jgi:hypothetical protein
LATNKNRSDTFNDFILTEPIRPGFFETLSKNQRDGVKTKLNSYL